MCVLCYVLSHSVVSDSDPMVCSPPGSSVHGDSPEKNTRVGCHAFLQTIFPTRDQTQVSRIAGRFFTSWATREAQECWSGQPTSSPGDPPDRGIEPGSLALQADFIPAQLPGKPNTVNTQQLKKKNELGLLGGSVVKNSPANAGDTGLIPGPGRSYMLRSNQACVPQLLNLCSRTRVTTSEASAPNSPCCATREATAEKSAHSNQREALALHNQRKAHAAKKTQHRPK